MGRATMGGGSNPTAKADSFFSNTDFVACVALLSVKMVGYKVRVSFNPQVVRGLGSPRL